MERHLCEYLVRMACQMQQAAGAGITSCYDDPLAAAGMKVLLSIYLPTNHKPQITNLPFGQHMHAGREQDRQDRQHVARHLPASRHVGHLIHCQTQRIIHACEAAADSIRLASEGMPCTARLL